MKKIFKSRVFAFVLGALLFGSIGVVSAYTILANDIGYTPSNTTWKVDNVKDAIDDLYIKKAGENYSTDEKVVGTWVDGKPLYQKVILIEHSPSAGLSDLTVYTFTDNANIEIKTIQGYNYPYKNGKSLGAPLNYGHIYGDWGSYFWISENGEIKVGSGKDASIANFVFIVQYTKISDSASEQEG